MEEFKVTCPYCGNSRFHVEEEYGDEMEIVSHWRAVCIICGATGPWTITRTDALYKVKKHQQEHFEAVEALQVLKSIREDLRDIVVKRLDAFE